jgi:hypothetical protein
MLQERELTEQARKFGKEMSNLKLLIAKKDAELTQAQMRLAPVGGEKQNP